MQSPPLEKQAPKHGDRVRVVLEGEVTDTFNVNAPGMRIAGDDGRGAVNVFNIIENRAVQSIEVLPKPVQVGDKIRGLDAYDALPPGSVVKADGVYDDSSSIGQLVKLGRDNRWFSTSENQPFGALSDPRTLVYLPE